MAMFAKPENALNRASELLAVGQKSEAVTVLHDIIVTANKRHRSWSPVLETIMFKYLELCVDMRKGKVAKDGLHQYKSCTQQVNINSLENVVKYFLAKSEEHAQEAHKKAEELNLQLSHMDDLDEETDANAILSMVSVEGQKERTDRELVTPWLKFLWETYRTVLDILKNNGKLLHLYQDTVQQAFSFCTKYVRKNEFRRLCEILRQHLQLPKSNQAPDLTTPEVLQQVLETRFSQLNAATEIELWQEAFRTIEDIRQLMAKGKKPPKGRLMANYYRKLVQMFWVSKNLLFHGYSWFHYYILCTKQRKERSEEELQLLATQVMLASLCVPLRVEHTEDALVFDLQREKEAQLARVLQFSPFPSRRSLLADVISRDIISSAAPEVQTFYRVVEKGVNPYELCSQTQIMLDFVRNHSELQQYVQPLQRLAFTRLLQQFSEVYDTLHISSLASMATFMDPDCGNLETLVVQVIRTGLVDIAVDHGRCVYVFKSKNNLTSSLPRALQMFKKSLWIAVATVDEQFQQERANNRNSLFQRLYERIDTEHASLLARKDIIERKKERMELLSQKQEEERNLEIEAEQRLKEEMEQKRLAAEAKLREAERLRRAAEEEAQMEQRVWGKAVGSLAANAAEVKEPKVLLAEQFAKIERDSMELEKKVQTLTRKLDHLERAWREEEYPLVQQLCEQQKRLDREFYDQQVKEFLEQQQNSHAEALEARKRLNTMISEKEPFVKRTLAIRQQRAQEAWERQASDKKIEWKKLRRAQRKAEKEAALKAAQQREEREEAMKIEQEQKEKDEKEEQEAAASQASLLKEQQEKEEQARIANEQDLQKPSVQRRERPEQSRQQAEDSVSPARQVPRDGRDSNDDRSAPIRDGERDVSAGPKSEETQMKSKYVPPARRRLPPRDPRDYEDDRGPLDSFERRSDHRYPEDHRRPDDDRSSHDRDYRGGGYGPSYGGGGYDDRRGSGYDDRDRRGGGYDDRDRRGSGYDDRDRPRSGYDDHDRRGGGYDDRDRRGGGYDDRDRLGRYDDRHRSRGDDLSRRGEYDQRDDRPRRDYDQKDDAALPQPDPRQPVGDTDDGFQTVVHKRH